MPRNYQRKTKKGSWTSDTLKQAIQSVRNKELSLRLASRRYNIPFTTLQNRMKSSNGENAKFGRKAVLSLEQEKVIGDHLLKLSRMFYGLTRTEVRRTVYSYVEANNIPNSFNKVAKMAGKDWLKGFLKRNKKISIRKPEATSINRIQAFNKPAVSLFYENLDSVMKSHNFQPDRIYNVDETGLTTVHEPEEILAEKGVKQVGAATSGERGKTHTACCCVSASGFYIPPMVIFPRVRMSAKLMIDGVPGAIYRCSKSGWINESLFLEWIDHFVKKSNASKEDPVLLIMDNHTSHISMEAYNLCVANGIHVVTLPPHTSHKLQPLDRTVFGPFKAAFNAEREAEMKAHAFQNLTSEQIPSLFRKAWTKICSTEKAVNGFRAAGIYPFNPNIFPDDEYYQLEAEGVEENVLNAGETVAESVSSCEENEESDGDNYEEAKEIVEVEGCDDTEGGNETVQEISFSTFAPLPQNHKVKKTNRGRPKQKSEIMTSPAYKVVLEQNLQKKIIRDEKKVAAAQKKVTKGENPVKTVDVAEKPNKTAAAKKPRKMSIQKATKNETGNAELSMGELSSINQGNQGKPSISTESNVVTCVQSTRKLRSTGTASSDKTIGVQSSLNNNESSMKVAIGGSTRKRRRLLSVNRDKPSLDSAGKASSDKTKGVEPILEERSDIHQQSAQVECRITKKRRVASEKVNVGLTKRGALSRKNTKLKKAETSDETLHLNDLLDGLCFLCGEKYQAEFFVCVHCSNCIHIGCSSQQSIVDETCSDCMN